MFGPAAPGEQATDGRKSRQDGTVSADLSTPLLVASDIDGTLINPAEEITPRTKAAVAAVVASDTRFVLATGRPPRWVVPIADQLGFGPLAICGNGAVLYDSAADQVLSTRSLEVDTLRAIADLAYTYLPGCGLAAERVGASVHDTATAHFVSTPDYQHAWLNPTHNPAPVDEVLDSPAIKLLIRVAGARSSQMYAALAPHVDGLAEVTFSTENGLIELSVPGVSKGSAIASLAEAHGIPAERVLVFGDMPNDLEMFSYAGHAVAMENAADTVKQIADEVTTTNSADGVARILERWWR